MPIYLPVGLPATASLREEGFEVGTPPPSNADKTDRLRILLLNLMPDKQTTELQFARTLALSELPIEIVLLKPANHICKTAPSAHMEAFYKTWAEAACDPVDGLIVTGAPVETLNYEQVRYWRELTMIYEEARKRRIETLMICWAAQAALYHFHKVPKYCLSTKAFGIFPQQIFQFSSPYLHGIGSQFACPVSRSSEVRWSDLMKFDGLEVTAGSGEAGICLVEERSHGAVYMFNHLEYDAETLLCEYKRDRDRDPATVPPANCYPLNNPRNRPIRTWEDTAIKFYRNWLRMAARRRMVQSAIESSI